MINHHWPTLKESRPWKIHEAVFIAGYLYPISRSININACILKIHKHMWCCTTQRLLNIFNHFQWRQHPQHMWCFFILCCCFWHSRKLLQIRVIKTKSIFSIHESQGYRLLYSLTCFLFPWITSYIKNARRLTSKI